jgi:L-ribulose-5-phosphate 3-epimerase
MESDIGMDRQVTETAHGEAHLRLSIPIGSLPRSLPYLERFNLAVRAGFEGVEADPVPDPETAAVIRDAACRSGMAIHSVRNDGNWRYPLSSADPKVVEKGVQAVHQAIEQAHYWGADTVLLVPGNVDGAVSYREAYERSHSVIRSEILPVAERHGVVLGVENVWNGFLLSPLEYVRYIDAFESANARAYLDIGNMIFGHPEHWIDIAGSRIIKMHVKDFRLDKVARRFPLRPRGSYSFGPLGEGTVDWRAVYRGLARIGFSGWATTTELRRHVVARGIGRLEARAPVVGQAFANVQASLTLRSLRDAAKRFDRYLQ